MTEALLTWLFRSAVLLTLLLPLVFLLRRAMRPRFGTRVAYASWLLLIPALLPPLSLPRTVASLSPNLPGTDWSQLSYAVVAGDSVAMVGGPTLLLAIWLSGVMALLVRFARRQIHFRRLLGANTESDKIPFPEQASLPAWLPVRYSSAIRGAMVVGCLPPVLYLPRHKALPKEVLAHEAAHVRHGDPAWSLVFTLLRCLFWFLPWLHLAWPHFQTDQELAADESVLCRLNAQERYQYACLLAQSVGIDHPPAAQAWAGHSQIKERIRMIKNQPPSPPWMTGGLAVVVSALLVFSWVLAVAANGSLEAKQHDSQSGEYSGEVTTEMPEPIVRIPPRYPPEAAEAGLSGHVVMEGLITTGGSVTDVSVIRSEPAGVFDEAAIESFRKWRFKPASDDAGELVARTVRTMIEFEHETN